MKDAKGKQMEEGRDSNGELTLRWGSTLISPHKRGDVSERQQRESKWKECAPVWQLGLCVGIRPQLPDSTSVPGTLNPSLSPQDEDHCERDRDDQRLRN